MTQASALDHGLRTILRALEPYLPDLVLIGGWIPYLYRHYGPFGEWNGQDTLTRELDLLIDTPLASGERPALAILLAAARFRAEGPAVWVRDIEAGEKIEFLAAHRGTARGSGVPVPVANQPGLSAIPLPGLELLRDDTRVLHLPEKGDLPEIEVRVPTLGAFVINKGATFMRRGDRLDDDGHPKKAKDLLYLRDLMAAGADVVDEIENDVERITRSSRQHADTVVTAANHLGLIVSGNSDPVLRAVVRMITEREPVPDANDAQARTAGYLTDLHEILANAAETLTDGGSA